jgi:hypothetical protein
MQIATAAASPLPRLGPAWSPPSPCRPQAAQAPSISGPGTGPGGREVAPRLRRGRAGRCAGQARAGRTGSCRHGQHQGADNPMRVRSLEHRCVSFFYSPDSTSRLAAGRYPGREPRARPRRLANQAPVRVSTGRWTGVYDIGACFASMSRGPLDCGNMSKRAVVPRVPGSPENPAEQHAACLAASLAHRQVKLTRGVSVFFGHAQPVHVTADKPPTTIAGRRRQAPAGRRRGRTGAASRHAAERSSWQENTH